MHQAIRRRKPVVVTQRAMTSFYTVTQEYVQIFHRPLQRNITWCHVKSCHCALSDSSTVTGCSRAGRVALRVTDRTGAERFFRA
jgi:hypothetical protein